MASTTRAAALRRLGGYDHGNGYDHDCGGSTTTAITTLTMVTIAAAMVTIAEPKSVDRHHFHPLRTPPSPPQVTRVTTRTKKTISWSAWFLLIGLVGAWFWLVGLVLVGRPDSGWSTWF